MILQFLSFPFSISVHDFCRSEARYRIIVAFLRLKYVLVETGIVVLLIKILFTSVILKKSVKESVDNLKIQHILALSIYLVLDLESLHLILLQVVVLSCTRKIWLDPIL